jgi:hypothetical protein
MNEMTSKIEHIENLLDRFVYSQNSKCGFLFFIGGSMLTVNSKEELESIRIAQNQITQFDINEEYEKLLGSLRDLYIQDFFEELIWRLDANIEPRKVKVPGTDVEVSEFNFENNKLLKGDDSKIEKLFDAEHCLNTLLEGVGEELTNNKYDLIKSYKAGMCFFNLKAQTVLIFPKPCSSLNRRTNNLGRVNSKDMMFFSQQEELLEIQHIMVTR